MAAATSCLTSALAAQTASEAREARTWRLQGLRAGYCIRFLVKAENAARELRPGFLLLRADQDAMLHPALRQVMASQPEFASWIPSNLCLYYLDAVQVGNRRVAEKDRRKYQLLGVWTLATREQTGGARRDLVLDMYAGRGKLVRAAEAAQIRLREVESSIGDEPDTSADLYSIKAGKTLLVWNGRPTGDSTRVQRPIRESWSVTSPRRTIKGAQLIFAPAWSRPLVGSLRVEGKGDLSKALRSSPIRFVGPLYSGGTGELRFTQ